MKNICLTSSQQRRFSLSLLSRLYICKTGIFSKYEENIRKGIEGMNDSQCLLLLLLTFVFYKNLYSLKISICFFLFLYSSFISAVCRLTNFLH